MPPRARGVACPYNESLVQELERVRGDVPSGNDITMAQKRYRVALRKAIASLHVFPLPVVNGEMAQKFVDGVGKTTAKVIDRYLRKADRWRDPSSEDTVFPCDMSLELHKILVDTSSSLRADEEVLRQCGRLEDEAQIETVFVEASVAPQSSSAAACNKKRKSKYRPKKDAQPYRFLMAMFRLRQAALGRRDAEVRSDDAEPSFRRDVIHQAVKQCFGDSGHSHAQAWRQSVTNVLVKNDLVVVSDEFEVALSAQGAETAANMCDDAFREVLLRTPKRARPKGVRVASLPQQRLVPQMDSTDVQRGAAWPRDMLLLSLRRPSAAQVVLLIDNREELQRKKKNAFCQKLREAGVQCEIRALALGDFAFVARDPLNLEQEVVLNCLVERKKLDDLVASIKDGRYREQKFRLDTCGISRIVYLLEGTRWPGAMPESALHKTMATSDADEGFYVRRTRTAEDSVRALKNLYVALRARVHKQQVPLSGPTLTEFSALMSKKSATQWNAGQMLAVQLMCIKGVSSGTANAVRERFPTVRALFDFLRSCEGGHKERVKHIADLKVARR
ncbi:MAG: hypothetical protein MHM6MM_004041 [Cercozoa sp. M6MM]